MSYTVLARKWRPKNFSEMAGQEHVRRALVNALDENRLHHAFLFSGTRGVGKTTIARILAKCLNCEKGVTSEPCGDCANCREIDEGRFVDLIEVDAASRTKVDDTRELLDNVQYRPTRGSYKVYLIDEVHMLSKHSFNALLKTLEEPPEHVKFLLATTDPQKLPVTVLSRCLQFNLKKLPVDLIAERMQEICGSEKIPSAEPALMRLARAAAGSMRDGLSLLDQAIAFGGGEISDDDVRTMLGTIDRQDVALMIEALIAGDGAALMQQVAVMDEHAPDYEAALIEMAALIQRTALAQAVPGAIDDSRGDRELVTRLAAIAGAEALQLYYQIALIGRRDLYLAADPRGGFEMVLLRMLAFRPAGAQDRLGAVGTVAGVAADRSAAVSKSKKPAAATAKKPSAVPAKAKKPPVAKKTVAATTRPTDPSASKSETAAPPKGAPAATTARAKQPLPAAPVDTAAKTAADDDWPAVVAEMGVKGAARQLANNCEFSRCEGNVWHLTLDERHSHLLTDQLRARLKKALATRAGTDVDLRIEVGCPQTETPAVISEKAVADRLDTARESIDNDPNVKRLKDTFGATVVEDSVQPADPDDSGNQELF